MIWKPCPCQFGEFEGNLAICRVICDGFDLPRVSFARSLFDDLKLNSGDWFWWQKTLDGENIIDPQCNYGSLEEVDSEELERLYQKLVLMREPWDEYTGDGK